MPTGVQRAAALIAAGALATCAPRAREQGQNQAAIPVPVATPLVERVVDWADYSGLFEAAQRVEVRARVGGYLEAVHFRDGQEVEAGDLLFTIDPRPYQAAVASAHAEVVRARVNVDQAERDLERARALVQSRTVSQQSYEVAQTELEEAQASLRAAEGALRQSQLDLEFTRIAAPISGRISDRRVDVGNLITPDGQTLTTIVAITPIYFEFDAPESALLAYLRQPHEIGGEDAVQVRLAGESEYGLEGPLTFADNVVDPGTGTIRLRAEIENPDGFLRPGMFGEARVRASAPYDAILIPETAVLADATRRLVYVLDDADAVQPRPVVLGPLSDELRVIREGLAPEDRVLLSRLQQVRPGMTVAPQPGEVTRRAPSEAAALEPSGRPPAATTAIPVE